MKNIISPNKLFAFTFAQVLIAYIFGMDGYAKTYLIKLSYMPLLLWLFAFIFFSLGDVCVRLLSEIFNGDIKNYKYLLKEKIELVNIRRLRIINLISTLGLFITSGLIIAHTGALPLLTIISQSKSISQINQEQVNAMPGLFGMHMLIIYVLEYGIGILLLQLLFAKKRFVIEILALSIVAILSGILDGKRQNLAMFICFFFMIIVNAKNTLPDKFKINYKIITITSSVVILMFSLIYFMTYIRLDASGYSGEVFGEPLRYLSMPLINFESLYTNAGLLGSEFDLLAPFNYLLPAKFGVERGIDSFQLPEPSSPYGFFAMAYINWFGIFGVAYYSLILGVMSGWVYSKIDKSPFYLLLYCHMVWAIIMSHTYNHFLTITFMPLQVFAILLLYYLLSIRFSLAKLKISFLK